jgi:hypothetical protein
VTPTGNECRLKKRFLDIWNIFLAKTLGKVKEGIISFQQDKFTTCIQCETTKHKINSKA